MNIIDALLGEHAVIYSLFDQCEADARPGGSVSEVRAQAALLTRALVSHARLEDELLFDRLTGRAGADAALLTVVRDDHHEIERALGAARSASDLATARDQLTVAIAVARAHFAREERALFPLAERLLDAELLTEMGADWASRRGVSVTERPGTASAAR
jgi:hemerythrin-like domain-containing protein